MVNDNPLQQNTLITGFLSLSHTHTHYLYLSETQKALYFVEVLGSQVESTNLITILPNKNSS